MMKDISFGIWKRKSHKSFKICMRRSAEANIPHKKFFLYHGPIWCTRLDDWRCIGLWKKAPCLSDFLGWPQRSHRTSLWKVHEKQFLHLQAKWLLVSCGILMAIYIKAFWALKHEKEEFVNFAFHVVNYVYYEIHPTFK